MISNLEFAVYMPDRMRVSFTSPKYFGFHPIHEKMSINQMTNVNDGIPFERNSVANLIVSPDSRMFSLYTRNSTEYKTKLW